MNFEKEQLAADWFQQHGHKRGQLLTIPSYALLTYGAEFCLTKGYVLRDLSDKVLGTIKAVRGEQTVPMAIFIKENLVPQAQEKGFRLFSRIVQTSIYVAWDIPDQFIVLDVDNYQSKGMAYPDVGSIVTRNLTGLSKDLVVVHTLPKPTRYGCYRLNSKILVCNEASHVVFN